MPLRSVQALCLMSFFLADVRDGLGPFLGVFLVSHQWQADDIGLMISLAGYAGLLATFPSGMLVDSTIHKRLVIVLSTLLIMFSTLLIWCMATPLYVAGSQIVTGIAAAIIPPAIAGITLGLTGQEGFSHQMGRNEAFNHAGNMSAALLAGVGSWLWGYSAIFILAAVTAIGAIYAALLINKHDIDHEVARGGASGSNHERTSSLFVVMKMPALLLIGFTLLLFHLSNAAQLPLLSMQVAQREDSWLNPGAFAAVTVVIAQLVMIPVALLTARQSSKIGFEKLILIALLVLPVRAMLASYWSEPLAAIPVQILDGIGAGILGVAVPGFVVSLLNGTGHVNAGQSAVMLFQGIGAATSPALAGYVVKLYSYHVSFVMLATIALVALLIWGVFMAKCRSEQDGTLQ